MDDKIRVQLIRKGNQLFNEGKIKEAARIFEKVNYMDGLVRVGDYYLFEAYQPLLALYYYKRSGHKKRLNQVYKSMAQVIRLWLLEDKRTMFQNMSSEEFAKAILEELKSIKSSKGGSAKNVKDDQARNTSSSILKESPETKRIEPYKFPKL